ncbi:hypothetical protein ACIQVO_34075 [Streptomyces sp. NPDC101062]|uniref:hypothetical protein n=1 Tax=unclassified Streptomyces TaxID=2593676 RepID=UPI002E77C373|nr:hypothetical protein [Streptomyces sp. JV176]MEE1798629.1 hypothetical protein [Streptomyces sp. JV176]
MSSPVRIRAGAAPRLLRAAVFTAVCVLLSATGHAVAACAPVPWWTLLVGFLGVFAVAAPLAGRARSTGAVVIALAGGQLGLHTLFGIGQHQIRVPAGSDDVLIRMAARFVCGAGSGPLSPVDAQRILAEAGVAAPTSTGAAQSAAGGAHHHMATVGSAATGPLTASGEGLLPSVPMMLAHLLAALAAGWLLRRGDLALLRLGKLSADGIGEVAESAPLRALRAALALVRALRAGLPGVPTPEPRAAHASSHGAHPVPAGETLQHTVIRRGPPAVCALAA